MFANAFQSGFISIFYSVGSSPLQIWDKAVKNGHIRRIIDDEVKSLVLEISGTNVATTYITCPIKPRASLGVRLPFLVMVVKNLKKYFTFEIQILDDKDIRRRFRVSNFQSTTKVRPFCTTMPIGLSPGWNQIQFNLADFTRRAYGTLYLETVRVQIHANVRIRRIYFSDRLYTEEELPSEYKLFLPISEAKTRGKALHRPSKTTKPTVALKAEEKAPIEPHEEPIPSGAPPTPTEATQPDVTETISEPVASTEAEVGDVPAEIKEEMEMESPVEGEGPTEGEAPSEAPPEGEVPAVEEGEVPAEGDVTSAEPAEIVEDAPAPAPADVAPDAEA